MQTLPRGSKAKFVFASQVGIQPSPSLLQGSKVEVHPLAHAQFASCTSSGD